MEIIKVKIEEIIPYGNNAKLHPQEQIKQIMKSIQEFGNNDPIAIDENNMIIEGHGRYEALKQLNYKEVECIRLSHMSEEQKKAYILVHNQLTMNTGFDLDILNEELKSIGKINMGDYDLTLTDIYDLIETDYSEGGHNSESFGVKVNLKNEHREPFETYIKKNTKQSLVDLIIRELNK